VSVWSKVLLVEFGEWLEQSETSGIWWLGGEKWD